MASYKENRAFAEDLFGSDLLDSVVDWVRTNLDIIDVFESDEIKEYIADNYSIEDIFTKAELDEWAEDNGYKKENS